MAILMALIICDCTLLKQNIQQMFKIEGLAGTSADKSTCQWLQETRFTGCLMKGGILALDDYSPGLLKSLSIWLLSLM